MPGEQVYIAGIIVLVVVVAAITTAVVLSLASSDNGDSDDFMSTLVGPKHYHANSENNANIVLIILDDVGWADFSHHNTDPWSALQTPNIDAIFKEGLSFTNFYTQAVCTPARGSMMTGRWTWALGLQHNMVLRTCTDARLSWDIPTWGELLKNKDYKNYYYGKWHLGMDSWKSTPRGRGWDSFLGPLNSDHESAGGAQNGKGTWFTINDDWDCDLSLADQQITTNSCTECMFRSYDYKYVEFTQIILSVMFSQSRHLKLPALSLILKTFMLMKLLFSGMEVFIISIWESLLWIGGRTIHLPTLISPSILI